MLITSTSNEKIKRLRALYKDKKLREQMGVYVAEGINFIKDLPGKDSVVALYIRENNYQELKFLEKQFGVEAYIIAEGIFDAVADTVTPSGVIAVLKRKQFLGSFGDFVIVLDNISDAGNLGAILRTACARGITTAICIDTVDPYNPKAVRASMGGINYMNIVASDTDNALKLLSAYDIVSLSLGGENFFKYKKEGKTALVVGSESHGVSKQILDKSKIILTIPMSGSVESLNAAVSAGIAMYLVN